MISRDFIEKIQKGSNELFNQGTPILLKSKSSPMTYLQEGATTNCGEKLDNIIQFNTNAMSIETNLLHAY